MAEWQMVRVRKKTHKDLCVLQSLFNSLSMKGQMNDVPQHDRFGISLDTVIRILIERDNDHRERGRKTAVAKAKAMLAEMDAQKADEAIP